MVRGFEDNYNKRAMEGWELKGEEKETETPSGGSLLMIGMGSVVAGQPHPYTLPPPHE